MARYDESDRDKTSWNIASAQAQHVSELLKKSTNLYLKGDLGNWFWTLSALRELVNYDLKEKERDELDEMETELSKLHSQYVRLKNLEVELRNHDFFLVKSEFAKKIKNYQRKIMDLLKTLGFFPAKEDRQKMGF